MDFNQLLHNFDPVVVFFRVLQGLVAAGIVWLIVRFRKVLEHIMGGANREKILEGKLKKAEQEIVELYDHKDEDRRIINRQHEALIRLSNRVDALEERAEAAETEVSRLKVLLVTHGIAEV